MEKVPVNLLVTTVSNNNGIQVILSLIQLVMGSILFKAVILHRLSTQVQEVPAKSPL